MSRAIMLWTGGKDSMLALTEARLQGVAVAALVTFTPPSPHFLAHPLPLIHAQADALALPLYRMTITAPYATSYERALAELRERLGIDCVITGDIAPVGAPNWIVERCHSLSASPLGEAQEGAAGAPPLASYRVPLLLREYSQPPC